MYMVPYGDDLFDDFRSPFENFFKSIEARPEVKNFMTTDVIENDDGFKWYEGYDYCLSGVVILDFVDAAEKYSGVDVSGIREELVKKRAWYYETYKSGDE